MSPSVETSAPAGETSGPSLNEALTRLVREGIGDSHRPFAMTNITPPRVGGDLPGGDLERSEQAGGAVADVVVGLLLENALAQRQDRLRSVQSLDLALLMTSTAAPITYERLVSWDRRPHRHYSASGPKQADGLSSADAPPWAATTSAQPTNTSATPAREVRTVSTRTEPSHLDAIRGVA